MRREGQSQYGYELYDAYAAIGMATAWRALAQLAGVMLLICPVVMEGKLTVRWIILPFSLYNPMNTDGQPNQRAKIRLRICESQSNSSANSAPNVLRKNSQMIFPRRNEGIRSEGSHKTDPN